MIEFSPSLFDVYALSLPAGLAFGADTPCGACRSENGETLAALTRNETSGNFGCLIMRVMFENSARVLDRIEEDFYESQVTSN